MSVITAICIICSIFIISLFSFLTLVYLSELKREKELRKFLTDSIASDLQPSTLPLVIVPTTSKPADILPLKPKKTIN